MGGGMGVSLDQFKAFVAQQGNVMHDQVHVDGESGSLVSCTNSGMSKIQRFFRRISSSGSEQSRANQQVRDTLLAAVRNEFGGKIPDSVKALLEKSGVDTSLTGRGQQSTKSLSTRAIRVILNKVDEAHAKAEADRLSGAAINGEISKTSAQSLFKFVVGKYASEMHDCVKDSETKGKIDKFIAKLSDPDSEVPPTKALRLAYTLLVGLPKLTPSISARAIANSKLVKPDVPPLPTYPEEPKLDASEPVMPEKPGSSFFAGLASIFGGKSTEPTDAEKAKYEQDMAEYNKKMEEFRPKKDAYEAAYEKYLPLKAEYDKARADYNAKTAAMQEYEKNLANEEKAAVADFLSEFLKDMEDFCNGGAFPEHMIRDLDSVAKQTNPDLWNKEFLPMLDEFDKTLDLPAKSDGVKLANDMGFVMVEKPKSESKNVAATVKLDVVELFSTVKGGLIDVLSAKLNGKATFSDANLVPAGDGRTLRLEMSNFKVDERFKAVMGVNYEKINSAKLTVPITFDTDPSTGRLLVKVGKLSNEKLDSMDEKQAELFNLFLQTVRPAISIGISSALGSAATGEKNVALSDIWNTEAMRGRDTVPVEIANAEGLDVFSIVVDPGKLAPLKAMGFDEDTKFSGVHVENGSITLQVGGGKDMIHNTSVVPNSTVSATANFAGVADRVKHLLSANGMSAANFTIAGDPNTGKITVDVDKLDLSQKARHAKFPMSTILKLLSKESFQLSFTPSLDAATGDITLKIDDVRNKVGARRGAKGAIAKWGAKKFSHVIESMLREALAPVTGFDKDHPAISVVKDPDGGVLKLTVKTSSILKLPQGVTDLTGKDFKPQALKVTEEGLGVGFNFVRFSTDQVIDRAWKLFDECLKTFPEEDRSTLTGVAKEILAPNIKGTMLGLGPLDMDGLRAKFMRATSESPEHVAAINGFLEKVNDLIVG